MTRAPRPLTLACCCALGLAALYAAPTSVAPFAQTAQAAPFEPDRTTSGWALGEHFHALAAREVQRADYAEDGREHLERAAALLEAAMQVSPDEARHPWLLTDVALRLGERDMALEALTAYRSLDRDDEVAAIRFIDLTLATMQTADAKLDYLERVRGASSVPEAVKSHAAMVASDLHARTGDDEASQEALAEALELNDLNLPALQRRLETAQRTGDAAARVGAAADLLAANPLQPAVMLLVGEELADAGLIGESARWYERGLRTALDMQLRADPQDYVKHAALLLLNDEPQEASATVRPVLDAQPDHAGALMLNLLAERQLGRPVTEDSAVYREARQAVTARLNALSAVAAGEDVPERPSRDTLPDVVADAGQIAGAGDDAVRQAYVDALTDLAVLETLFLERAPAQEVLDATRALLGESHPVTARVLGWAALRDGQADRARLKLSAAAERDPLARLGLLLVDGQPTRAEAEALLGDLEPGIVAALADDALRPTGARVPAGEAAGDVLAAIETLPDDAVDLLDGVVEPRDLYSLGLDPVSVAHSYGEPMLVRAAITNVGDLPITIGPGGLVRDDLRFDVSLAGSAGVGDIKRARLGGKVRLDPQQSIVRTVRIDAGPLGELLAANPMAPLTLNLNAFTNPIELGPGAFIPGPGGYRKTMRKPLQRTNFALANPDNQRDLFNAVKRGDGDERVRGVGLMARFLDLLRAQDDAGDYREVENRIERARDFEQDVNVRAMAGLMIATRAEDDEDRRRQVQALLSSDELANRMAGVVAAGTLPPEVRSDVLGKIAAGEGPVARYAASLLRDPAFNPAPDAETPAG